MPSFKLLKEQMSEDLSPLVTIMTLGHDMAV